MSPTGRYRVVLHVSGLAMPLDSGEVAVGFYANVVVHASNEPGAVQRAVSVLQSSRKYHAAVGVAKPTVLTDSVELLAARNAPPEGLAGGFVFYSADEAGGLA